VLYSGFCGAILFGKVLRIQSHAQVTFSDPIVIRYGPGVISERDEYDNDDSGPEKGIPCPVLEFRIINRLYGETGGEIMDATLSVVGNVNADDSDPNLSDQQSSRTGDSGRSLDSMSDTASATTDSFRIRQNSASLHRFFDPIMTIGRRDHHTIDEDPSARLVSKHIFSKMHIEAGEHPFFKRVWLARHILDDQSPILKPRIRESLQFNQILVSMNGVSNISASDVYAQKIYDFVDINIGYQFVNVLYRDVDGSLGVDKDLINDVHEQNGGGGEPLIFDD
jgi:hypothetical protein